MFTAAIVFICRCVRASTLHTGNNPTVMYFVSSLLRSSLHCDSWTGCMLCIGQSHYFRFNHPVEALRLKKNLSSNYHEVPKNVPGKFSMLGGRCCDRWVCVDFEGRPKLFDIHSPAHFRRASVVRFFSLPCGYLSGARCSLFAYGSADATAIPIVSCLI